MSGIRVIIQDLQESGMVVQGLSLEQVSELFSRDQRPVKEQLIALMAQGRALGVYFYQDQVEFEQGEFMRKLGEIGFGKDEAYSVAANLHPKPASELMQLGGRD